MQLVYWTENKRGTLLLEVNNKTVQNGQFLQELMAVSKALHTVENFFKHKQTWKEFDPPVLHPHEPVKRAG